MLQALLPEDRTLVEKSAYKIPAEQTVSIPLYLYNFSAKPARGALKASVSLESAGPAVAEPWGVEMLNKLELASGERRELSLRLANVSTNGIKSARVSVTGDFGSAGKPVLSLRLVPAAK